MFKAIQQFNEAMDKIPEASQKQIIIKRRNQLIVNELHNVIHYVTLAKVGILSPMILHLEEIQEITKHENEKVTMVDLLDVSKFKIIQNKDLIIIYIKYPIKERLCKYFEV